jgi:arylsulfatase
MWLFVPVQSVVQEFIATIDGYPFQPGSTLNASGINYQSLRAAGAIERLGQLETLMPPGRQ